MELVDAGEEAAGEVEVGGLWRRGARKGDRKGSYPPPLHSRPYYDHEAARRAQGGTDPSPEGAPLHWVWAWHPLALIRLTNAGSCPSRQRCFAATAARPAETKGTSQLPYGSGETKGEGMPLHFDWSH